MSNNTEVIFDNIEQRILKEIEGAHYAIFVSVAWFTNKKLFNALLEKAKNNCYVSIIIQQDEVNSQGRIDYSQIEIGRSEFFMISKEFELLHDKFCVIDFNKVITGSYNWTYKTAHYSENILILNDPSIAIQYISRFEQLKVTFQNSDTKKKLTSALKHEDYIGTQNANLNIEKNETDPYSYFYQCTCCRKRINFKNKFCPHCGTLQKRYEQSFSNLIVEVTCKECLYKQESALISAKDTNFCTFCGSDKLEWKLCRNNLNKLWR